MTGIARTAVPPAADGSGAPGWVARGLVLSWLRMPGVVERVSPGLARVLRDGWYLTRWPWIAAVAPSLAYAIGFVIGALRPFTAADDRYGLVSGAVPVVILLVMVSQLGAALGARLLVGFAVGEILVFGPAPQFDACRCGGFDALFKIRVPEAIEFAALGLLLVAIPLATVVLDPLLARVAAARGGLRAALAWASIALRAMIAAILVAAWAQAFPVLQRPMFDWIRENASADGIRPLQEAVLTVAGVAALVAAIRGVLELLVTTPRPAPRPVSEARSPRRRLPIVLTIPLTAGLLTLFLAGLIDDLVDVALLFGGSALAFGLRWALARTPWAPSVRRVPGIFRVLLAAGASYVIVGLLTDQMGLTASWRPVVAALVVSLLITAALLPDGTGPMPRVVSPGQGTASGSRATGESPA